GVIATVLEGAQQLRCHATEVVSGSFVDQSDDAAHAGGSLPKAASLNHTDGAACPASVGTGTCLTNGTCDPSGSTKVPFVKHVPCLLGLSGSTDRRWPSSAHRRGRCSRCARGRARGVRAPAGTPASPAACAPRPCRARRGT